MPLNDRLGWRRRTGLWLLLSFICMPIAAKEPKDTPWIERYPHLNERLNAWVETVNEWGGSAQDELSEYDALFAAVKRHAGRYWEDVKLSQPKQLVTYSDHYQSRTELDFDKGRIVVETIKGDHSLDELKALIRDAIAIPTEGDPDYISDQEGQDGVPTLLSGQIVDQEGETVRYAWRSQRYADWLVEHRLQKRQQADGSIVYRVEVPLVRDHLRVRGEKFESMVRTASQRHDVPEPLIYAIIATESSFNPYAISHVPAYGLMQVVPKTAGADVFQRVYRRSGQPGRSFLFDPAKNIDVGAAYLSLLDHVYLKNIHNPQSRRWCIIAAYNGGAGNVFKTFGRNQVDAISRINALTPRQVFQRLHRHHPALETRRYVQKVGEARQRYRSLAQARG
ncbi:murein transglycosylase domain-containing protein [Phytohalomonas tamaricis]|uniref:murein transglycosylase domain-containing protein n=1 Tax=Phytohalomonas tamaricis TaxID=2081032 RepID=UPI000D0BDD9F|nr:murein transglycosylase domain-containing protein [Phytohalomonas tamaricis]